MLKCSSAFITVHHVKVFISMHDVKVFISIQNSAPCLTVHHHSKQSTILKCSSAFITVQLFNCYHGATAVKH